jgi:hypothetical protein
MPQSEGWETMTIRLRLAVALLVLGTLTAQAAGTDEQKAALIAAIEANGCLVTGENAQAVMTAAALDPATAESIINDLGEAGMAEKTEAGLKLKTANCP